MRGVSVRLGRVDIFLAPWRISHRTVPTVLRLLVVTRALANQPALLKRIFLFGGRTNGGRCLIGLRGCIRGNLRSETLLDLYSTSLKNAWADYGQVVGAL